MKYLFEPGRHLTFEGVCTVKNLEHQMNLLGNAIYDCVVAAGIVSQDAVPLSGPQLLQCAGDLHEYLKAEQAYPPCDYCHTAMDKMPWHGSGEFEGKESRHIHACDACRHLLPGKQALSMSESELRHAFETYMVENFSYQPATLRSLRLADIEKGYQGLAVPMAWRIYKELKDAKLESV